MKGPVCPPLVEDDPGALTLLHPHGSEKGPSRLLSKAQKKILGPDGERLEACVPEGRLRLLRHRERTGGLKGKPREAEHEDEGAG